MTAVGTVRQAEIAGTRRRNSGFRAVFVAALSLAAMLTMHCARAQSLSRVVRLDIRAQTLDAALLQFGRQASVQISFATRITRRLRTRALKGKYTVRQALRSLLGHSGLGFVQRGREIEIVSLKDRTHALHRPARRRAHRHRQGGHFIALQEVVVTGTHIGGGPPASAPIITITRRDIEESGYQTVEQVMDALPENFASVGSGQTYDLTAENDAGNISNGAAVDLDGLGFDSTLVLVNGHRLAPSGTRGAFTDVSVIPLSAIKRIDVLTGGASAIYGSDAIGGVVNYVLRSHEQGAETSLEYGSVTRGGLKDYRASQSVGTRWRNGSVFAAYEFHKRTALSAQDRAFSSSAGPYTLLPDATQNNLYVTATQDVGHRTTLQGDLFYEQRSDRNAFAYNSGPVGSNSKSRQYSAGIGVIRRLGGRWQGHLRLRYGGSHASGEDIFGTESGDSGLLTVSTGAQGPIVDLTSGVVRAAVGLELRGESFSSRFSGIAASEKNLDKRRTVDAAYAEARIPLWANRGGAHEAPLMSADLAGRYEHYSDFGSSFNPMAGLAWQPMAGFRLRGTVSSSFRAPNFYELYGADQAELINSPYPGSQGGSEAVLILLGANPALKPEKSTEWTAGVDVAPPGSTMHVKITYFHVHFKDRIASPDIPELAALDQGQTYAPYIEWNPSLNELESSVSAATEYYNVTVYPGFGPQRALSDAVAIANDRLQNVGVTNVSGVDADIYEAGQIAGLDYRLGAQTTYLLRYEDIFVPGAAPLEVLSTFQNPVDFRARVTAGINRGRWSGNAALNFTNHYSDTTQGTPVNVASWTTFDVQIAYRMPLWRSSGGLTASLSCQNCANRDPPSLRTSTYLLGFDPANASPIGRFVSLTLRKRW